MILKRIELRNFRCFEDFSLNLDGSSAFVVAPNGGGKTSLLECLAKGCGIGRSVSREDFRDIEIPIEIVLTISDLPVDAIGIFADHTQFGQGQPVVKMGMRAVWMEEEQELDVMHGFPEPTWTRSTRAQRDALAVLWLPANRDPSRSLQLVGSPSVLADLVGGLQLDEALQVAVQALDQAAQNLAATEQLAHLLQAASADLDQMASREQARAFQLAPSASTDEDLLRQLQLLINDEAIGTALPIIRQSSGLAQLALFAFVLRALSVEESNVLLLVDEPELSLHPHAQRALAARLRDSAAQALITTHSSNVLDRADPRSVIRLNDTANGVVASSSGTISDAEAIRLTRISDPRTAEAFFATRVLVVEGESDHAAIRALADRLGKNLDAEGISVISLEGAGTFSTFFSLLGRTGLDIPLGGLCDVDEEPTWRGVLASSGLEVEDASDMASAGFFVCHEDLEDELFRALGATGVEAALRSGGEGAAFDRFAEQPTQSGTHEDVLRRYVDKNKVRCAPILIDALDLDANIPIPLNDLLSHA